MVIPIIIGVVVGIAFIVSSCSNESEGADAATPDAAGDETWWSDVAQRYNDVLSDAPTPADAARPGDASEATDALKLTDVAEAIEAKVDSIVDSFTLDNADAPQAPDAAEVVTQPSAPVPELFADMPCGYPASLAFDQKNMAFYTTCGMPNALFRYDNFTDDSGWDWEKVGDVSGYPSNHIALPDGHHLVAHSMPDGFTVLDEASGSTASGVDFSEIEIDGEDGLPLNFVPNNPTGAALAGGNLCLATSNIDTFDADPAKTTFFPGTFICFAYPVNGDVTQEPIAFYTSGKNPTGVALLDGEPSEDGSQRVAVLSSNSYAPSADSNAFVDVFTAPQMTRESFKVETPYGEPATAQISPTIAIASGGTLLIGLQKPCAALLGLDPETGETEFYFKLPQVKNFISSIDSSEDVAAVSDFGVFGAGGRVVFLNLSGNPWQDSVETLISGSLGPSTIAGGTLFQTATGDDMAGKLWKMDMSGLY